MIDAASMVERPFLHPDHPLLTIDLYSATCNDNSVTTVLATCSMQLGRDIERYAFRFVSLSLPGFRIVTPLSCLQTTMCQPVQIATFISSAILSLSHNQSIPMAPKDSSPGPNAFFTD
jgi:hypothetical protein